MTKKRMTLKRNNVWKTKVLSLLFLPLIGSGCSYHDKQFSYFNMLDADKGTQQNKEAAQKFWSSVRPVSNLSASHYKLGRYYQQQGKHQQAITEFSKAIRNDSGYCKAYNAIAMSHDALKHCELAYKSYEQARQCDPQEAYIYNNYGCSSLLCGNYEQGLDLLRKAAQLSQDNLRIKNNIKLAQMFTERENNWQKQSAQEAPETLTASASSSLPSAENRDQILPAAPQPVIAADSPSESPYCEIAPPWMPVAAADNTCTESSLQAISFNTQTLPVEMAAPPPIPTEEEPKTISQEADSGQQLSLENTIVIGELVTANSNEKTQTRPAATEMNRIIEVSNGNGVTGMAGKSADYFRRLGFSVGRITNAKDFRFHDSIIFYEEGYLQVAKQLAEVTPGVQMIEKVDSLGGRSIGVKILLGKDLANTQFPDKLPREDRVAMPETIPHVDSPDNAVLITAAYKKQTFHAIGTETQPN